METGDRCPRQQRPHSNNAASSDHLLQLRRDLCIGAIHRGDVWGVVEFVGEGEGGQSEMERERDPPPQSTSADTHLSVRGPWSSQEDEQLTALVRKKGALRWSHIANELPGRTGKQCRERWFNHLDPDVRKDEWTPEEDNIIVAKHMEVGNAWAVIAKILCGRTPNSVKNRWNATLKRLLHTGEFVLPPGYVIPDNGYEPPPRTGPPRPPGARQTFHRRRSRSRERTSPNKRSMDEISHTTAEDLGLSADEVLAHVARTARTPSPITPPSGSAASRDYRDVSPTTGLCRLMLLSEDENDLPSPAPQGEAYGMFSLESAPVEPEVKKLRPEDELKEEDGPRKGMGLENSMTSMGEIPPPNPGIVHSAAPAGSSDCGGVPNSGLSSSRGSFVPTPIDTTPDPLFEEDTLMVETMDGHQVPIQDYWISGSASTPSWNQRGTPLSLYNGAGLMALTPSGEPLVSPSYGMHFGSMGSLPSLSPAQLAQALLEDSAFLYMRSPSSQSRPAECPQAGGR